MDVKSIFASQRVLTPEEYAFLGYTPKEELVFDTGSYQTDVPSLPTWVPAYRADSKEQFLVDFGTLLAKTATTGPKGFFMTLGTLVLQG